MATTAQTHADRPFPPASKSPMPALAFVERRTTAPKTAANRLSSWKAIAAYLRQGVRTVQRWERECKLPVYRINSTPRSPVFAFPSEIDAWLRERKNPGNPVSASRDGRRMSAALVGNSKALMIRCASLQEKLQLEMERLGQQVNALRALPRVKSPDYSSIANAIDAVLSDQRR